MNRLPLKLRKISPRPFDYSSAIWGTEDGRFSFSLAGPGKPNWAVYHDEPFTRVFRGFSTLTEAVWWAYDQHYAEDREGPTALDEVLG